MTGNLEIRESDAAGLGSESGAAVAANAIGDAASITQDTAASPALDRPGLPPLIWGGALVALTLLILAALTLAGPLRS